MGPAKLAIELVIALIMFSMVVWIIRQVFPKFFQEEKETKDTELDNIYDQAQEVSNKKKDLSEQVAKKEEILSKTKETLNN